MYDQPGTVLSFFGHEASVGTLEPLLRYLSKKGFTFVSTNDLLKMRSGVLSPRKRMAWLTYDDGWKGLRSLLPALEKYHAPITVFVSPVETDREQAWPFHVESDVDSVLGQSVYSLLPSERYNRIDKDLGILRDVKELADWTELRELARHELVTIENHTNTHLSCSHVDVETMVDDIAKARDRLLNSGISLSRLVCYPFGHRTVQTDDAIRQMGMIPVLSNAGVMTIGTFGSCRNAFHKEKSFQENIGRVLGAWPASRNKQTTGVVQ